MTVYRKNREARCGWCITGDHEHCVVVVEAGLRDTSRTVKDPKWSKVPKPKMAPWRCRCWECEPWLTTRCVKCQRRGVEVDPYTSECVKDCSKVKKVPQPPVREIRVS